MSLTSTPLTYRKRMELITFAYVEAQDSPDPSTQNGAILFNQDTQLAILATAACNEFPDGVEYTDARWERPLKYSIIEHAERNAIYYAARCGIATEGLGMAAAWAACSNCARAIIQAGITYLLRHVPPEDGSQARWSDDIKLADQLLAEAGVFVDNFTGTDIGVNPIRRDGELWTP